MDRITIIPAGAGSGKTTWITRKLIDWVREEQVHPSRIVAVTFTEAGAGELRARIRGALLADGRVEETLALDRAHVSTIHALGLEIQTAHAFALGASPAPRHLSDAERSLLIRLEMANSEKMEELKADLGRFGYGDAYHRGTTAEDALRQDVLKMIDLLRGLGDAAFSEDLASDAIAVIRGRYGTVSNKPEALEAALGDAAKAFLDEFPQGGLVFCDENTPKSAVGDFRKELGMLRRALERENLARDWRLWQGLREMRIKINRSEMDKRYVQLAKGVMSAADGILRHPGPLEDCCRHFEMLVTGAQEVLLRYQQRKREAGLVDFADMVAGAEAALRQHPKIREAMLQETDCVIVDEFQDTNPVQFALIWQLASQAPRTVLVGDIKQSIMGFQGATPALMKALEQAFPEHVHPLDRNWRSDPRIMGFVNAVGAALLGDEYLPLEPQRPETGQTALEILRICNGPRSRSGSRPQHHVAVRIKELLEDQATVIDRTSEEPRPVRPGDVAILCRTNASAERYATHLRALGIPVRISEKGWLSAIATRVGLSALSLVADPEDTHAALCLLTLGPQAMPLQEAMDALADGSLLDEPSLEPLRDLGQRAAGIRVDTLVPQIMSLAGLDDWAGGLDDPHQAGADLQRLEHEAREFVSAHRDMRAAAGFYGQSLAVFLGWLQSREADGDFDTQPDPGEGARDGVEVITWHASKGREWNIVVVADLDAKIQEMPGTTRAQFAGFQDLSALLDNVRLKHVPRLTIPEKQDRFLADAQAAVEDEARRLIYVAFTRARDRLILEWPDHALKKKDDKVFAARMLENAGLEIGAGQIDMNGQKFGARIRNCEKALPEEFDAPGGVARAARIVPGEMRTLAEAKQTPWRTTPSAETHTAHLFEPDHLQHVALAPPVSAAPAGTDAAERGTALHLALRVMLSCPEQRGRLGPATGLSEDILDALEMQAGALANWMKDHGFDHWHTELPIQVIREDGSQTNAIIDCLAEGGEGCCIIDHKSGPAPDPAARFADYWPQLCAYRDAVQTVWPARPVRYLVINWIDEGKLSVMPVGGGRKKLFRP